MNLKVLAVVIACLANGAIAADKKEKPADTTAKSFVTVNGTGVPLLWADVLYRQQIARGAKDSPELKQNIRNALITNALIEQDAKKTNLDRNLQLQAQADMARQAVLIRAWEQKTLNDMEISDADIRTEYERQVARLGTTEYRIRQVVVSDENTAKQIQEKAQSGARMADLAREYSKATNAKENGGLTDWANAGNLIPPVWDAIGKLTKGNLASSPVKTASGWHILQLEETRPLKAPTLDETKGQIVQILKQRGLETKLNKMREEAKIN